MDNEAKRRVRDREGRFASYRVQRIKKVVKFVVLPIMVISLAYIALEQYSDWRWAHDYQFPVKVDVTFQPVIVEVDRIKYKPVIEETKESSESVLLNSWTGEASYYSFDGCVGCNANRVMANGEVLDDMEKTIAFNGLPMNTEVMITNLSNGAKTTAVVTDTGGFDKLGRIADLSLATKKVLDCEDLCQVRIEQFN